MAEEKKGFFKRLVAGLTKTRDNIVSGIDSIFHGFTNIDDDFYEELEETLIMGDLGVHATMDIIEDLKKKVNLSFLLTFFQSRDIIIYLCYYIICNLIFERIYSHAMDITQRHS